MSRVHKKTRLYIRDADKYLSEYEQPVADNHSFQGWLYRGYIICRGQEINPNSNFDGDRWFRSVEPFYGELLMDVQFEVEHGGWDTINCIMDNVDDAIDSVPLDRWNGVDWMVSFKRTTRDDKRGAVKITAPHWNVDNARDWIMQETGCYVSSISRIPHCAQPLCIAADAKAKQEFFEKYGETV